MAQVFRGGQTTTSGKYTSAYLGDTWSKSRLTINAGLRWDKQTAKNSPSEAPANVTFSDVLPALSFDGNTDNIIDFNDISPRLGLSYALDESRKTIVRASFARYANQLSFGNAGGTTGENPVGTSLLAFGWNDPTATASCSRTRSSSTTSSTTSTSTRPTRAPWAPPSTRSTATSAKHDKELIIGVDREIAGNFAVGVAYTYRRGTDWEQRLRLGGACSGLPTLDSCPTLGPENYTANAPSTAAASRPSVFAQPGARDRRRRRTHPHEP